MDKRIKSVTNDHLKKMPDHLANLLPELFDKRNFRKKIEARVTLVNLGKSIIPQRGKSLSSRDELLRLEMTKIVDMIADRQSMPVLIHLLDDPEFDIRWFAAEGLIKSGRKSIVPLLKVIRKGNGSYFLNKGAHHVLQGFISEREKEVLKPLLLSLNDYRETGEVPLKASVALIKTFRCRSKM